MPSITCFDFNPFGTIRISTLHLFLSHKMNATFIEVIGCRIFSITNQLENEHQDQQGNQKTSERKQSDNGNRIFVACIWCNQINPKSSGIRFQKQRSYGENQCSKDIDVDEDATHG